MNAAEKSMLDILKRLRGEYGAVSVKAEFEAEGTRTDEMLRLIDIARRADLKVGLKIGGCEAVRDLVESKQFGVEYIIAPMVETSYALQKFIDAKNKVYTLEQQGFTEFLFNLETITAFNSISDMVKVARATGGVQGIVFGRVDFAGSLGLTRSVIDTCAITDYAVKIAEACKESDLDLVVGGAVSIGSLAELRRIKACKMSRFETRKVIFTAEAIDSTQMTEGLKETVYFELLWLKNKRDFYAGIQMEDASRISMLEKRWTELSA